MSKFLIIMSAAFLANLAIAQVSNVKEVHGTDAITVFRTLQRSGMVQDGVSTPDGPASRIFGAYKGLPASCDVLWHTNKVEVCQIDQTLSVGN